MNYKIYCDGAASNNGYSNAVGGCGCVILDDQDNIVHEICDGPHEGATNNRMELYACYLGLFYVLENCKEIEMVDIYTDSAYLHNCKNNQWYVKWQQNGWVNSKRQVVANRDLWEKLIPAFDNPHFDFHKVDGHAGNEWNEYVDKLAVKAKSLKEENENG